jgi:hypothetical protein
VPTAWALLGAGSFGLRKLSLGHTGDSGGLRASATLSYQGAIGDFPYLSTGGLLLGGELVELRRRNDGFDQLAADVRLSGERRGGSYFLGAHGLLKQQGIAGVGQAQGQPGQPMLTLGRALLSGGGRADFLSGRLQLFLDGHGLLERSAVADPELQPPVRLEQLVEQAGARAMLRLSDSLPHPSQTLVLLAELRYEHLGTEDLCPAPRRNCEMARPAGSERLRAVLGLGGELRFGHDAGFADRLLVQPGVHVLLARSRLRPPAGVAATAAAAGEASDSDEAFLAPRLSARLHATRFLLLRASGGRFVRLPTFLELFGDGAFYRASLALRPESAWLLEAGGRLFGSPSLLRGRLPLQLSLEAHGFVRLTSDLITTVRDGPQLHAVNVGEALAAGVELEGRLQLGELFLGQLNYTFLDARNHTFEPGRSGKLLPGRPPHSLSLRVDVGYKAWRFGYELDYASLAYLDAANLQPRPARALSALRVQLGPFGRAHLAMSVEIRNLADTRALPVPLFSPTQDPSKAEEKLLPLADFFDYPLPGRSLYATLSGRL